MTLLEIVNRESCRQVESHPEAVIVDEEDPPTWCRSPQKRHTPTDREMYQAIYTCFLKIQLESEKYRQHSYDSWVSGNPTVCVTEKTAASDTTRLLTNGPPLLVTEQRSSTGTPLRHKARSTEGVAEESQGN